MKTMAAIVVLLLSEGLVATGTAWMLSGSKPPAKTVAAVAPPTRRRTNQRLTALDRSLARTASAREPAAKVCDDREGGVAPLTQPAETALPATQPAESAVAIATQPAEAQLPVTRPAARAPIQGIAITSIDEGGSPVDITAGLEKLELARLEDDRRFGPTTRPERPEPQHPPVSDEKNVDTNKPPHEWQRATDDWFGARPWLDDHGIVFQASLLGEYNKNLTGGLSTHQQEFRNLLNANITFDTKRLFGWEGGTAFINFQNQSGDSFDLAGAAQGYSNADADGRTQISEAWYEQVMLGGKFRLKVGKVDANTEFAFVRNGAEFANSSMGYSPTIVGFPTYPDPAFGLNAFVYPTEQIYAGFGVYDGAGQEGIATGSRGPATLFGSPGDLFFVGEVGVKWPGSQGREGRAGVGVWHHTGTFERFSGGRESGTTGFYAVADQTLWRANPGSDTDSRGISAYLQYGYADPSVSEFNHHVGVGAVWKGAIPTRDDDLIGLGLSWVRMSSNAGFEHSDELVVEAFYKLQLLRWISVKPDLQYIHNPAGAKNDALVIGVRALVDF